MDLANLDCSQSADRGAWLTLRHPSSGDDLPTRIKLAGQDSKIWKEREREFSDRRLQQMQKAGKLKITTAQVEERGVKMLAAVTMEWEGVELDGSALPCTKQNAEMVYRRFTWIANQVDEFVGECGNFMDVQEGEDARSASVFDGEAHMANAAKN